MAKKVDIVLKSFKDHTKAQEAYASRVSEIFNKAAQEAAAIGSMEVVEKGGSFSFQKYPKAKKAVDNLVDKLTQDITAVIQEGTTEEWLHAAKLNDTIVKQVFHNTKLKKAQIDKYMSRNLDALHSFQGRKLGGMNLSDRVWKYTDQFKEEIEMALDIGLGEGKSAASLSRTVRQYLKEPNKLFHKVKDKHGKLQLSKNAKAYHSGRGVYRSSYKNAMRLTRTEVNMAYRNSDFARTQQLDFVIGIRVRLSNNHTLNGKPFVDICDHLAGEYPKDFKFTGWHPQCRCYSETILASEDEFLEQQDKFLRGEDVSDYKFSGKIEQLPKNFLGWVDENAERIKTAKSMPYFLKDNFDGANIPQGAKNWIKSPKSKASQNVNEVKKKLQDQAALAYEKEYAQKKIEQALAAGYEGGELKALQIVLGTDGVTPSQLAGQSNKLLHSVKAHAKKQNTTPPPAAPQAVKDNIEKAVAQHKAKDPLRSELEKQFTAQETNGLLNAYHGHTAKKASMSSQGYLSYLEFEIDYIKKNTLSKYTTSPKLLSLLEAEYTKVKGIVSKELIQKGKELAAAKAAQKSVKPTVKAAPKAAQKIDAKKVGVLRNTTEHNAVVVDKAQKEVKRLESELKSGVKPTPNTLEARYTKTELTKLRKLELEYQKELINSGGNDWSDRAMNVEDRARVLRRDLSVKYYHKRTKLKPLDGMTKSQYEQLLKSGSYRIESYDLRYKTDAGRSLAKALDIHEYELKAVNKYTGSYAFELNRAIRDGNIKEGYSYFTTVLNRAINNLPRYEGTLRRGVNDSRGTVLKQLMDAIEKGVPWEDKAFVSGAYRGEGFRENLKMKIVTKKGGLINSMSKIPTEYEVLLRAGTKFKVESLYQEGHRWYATLIEL